MCRGASHIKSHDTIQTLSMICIRREKGNGKYITVESHRLGCSESMDDVLEWIQAQVQEKWAYGFLATTGLESDGR